MPISEGDASDVIIALRGHARDSLSPEISSFISAADLISQLGHLRLGNDWERDRKLSHPRNIGAIYVPAMQRCNGEAARSLPR